jgi:hypothetical protein
MKYRETHQVGEMVVTKSVEFDATNPLDVAKAAEIIRARFMEIPEQPGALRDNRGSPS